MQESWKKEKLDVGKLDVDNLTFDGANIGHSSDTDMITLGDGTINIGATNDNASVGINGNLTIGYLSGTDGVGNLNIVSKISPAYLRVAASA